MSLGIVRGPLYPGAAPGAAKTCMWAVGAGGCAVLHQYQRWCCLATTTAAAFAVSVMDCRNKQQWWGQHAPALCRATETARTAAVDSTEGKTWLY